MKSLAVVASVMSSILIGGCVVSTETDEYEPSEPIETVAEPLVKGVCAVGCAELSGAEKLACLRVCRTNLDNSCSVDEDCRFYHSFCRNCTCVPLNVDSPDPPCAGPLASCAKDPCEHFEPACVAGRCVRVPALF